MSPGCKCKGKQERIEKEVLLHTEYRYLYILDTDSAPFYPYTYRLFTGECEMPGEKKVSWYWYAHAGVLVLALGLAMARHIHV